MVRRTGESDQSVACLDQHGITINLDSTTFWRVDPQHVADLYHLRPDDPLTSTNLNVGIGNIVVRRLVRGVMHDACGEMAYTDIFGAKRSTYAQQVEDHGGQRRAAEYLLSRGADINFVPGYAKDTPLDIAGSLGTQRDLLVSWLREQGARPSSVEPTTSA